VVGAQGPLRVCGRACPGLMASLPGPASRAGWPMALSPCGPGRTAKPYFGNPISGVSRPFDARNGAGRSFSRSRTMCSVLGLATRTFSPPFFLRGALVRGRSKKGCQVGPKPPWGHLGRARWHGHSVAQCRPRLSFKTLVRIGRAAAKRCWFLSCILDVPSPVKRRPPPPPQASR